ncbi:MAG: excinuclease ABC subunit UvrA [Oligoflexus sp.]
MTASIVLRNVRTHNLKGCDIRIPLGSYTVVTGVSGSGKSSLVFDTLYGESYRRYVESLSSFARQYLKALPRPQVDDVEQLPASIAVQQSRYGQSNRSTVGTMTELLDVLRILFTHLSQIYCCGHLIRRETGDTVAQTIFQIYETGNLMVLAPLESWSHLKAKDLKAHLEGQGFTRAYINGEVQRIEKTTAKDLRQGHVIVDRIGIDDENYRRFADSTDLAFRLGRGKILIVHDSGKEHSFYAAMRCPTCDSQYHDPSLSLFNFNHPLGACETCQGFGRVAELDANKIIPDRSQSLQTQGVAAFNFGQHVGYYKDAIVSAKSHGIPASKAFADYTPEEWDWLFIGEEASRYDGIEGYFRWLDSKKYKAHYRIHAARFRTYVTCPSCEGRRLSRISMNYLIDGRNLAELCDFTLVQLDAWFEELAKTHLNDQRRSKVSMGAGEAIEEGQLRLRYLLKIGLGYLNLNRRSKSLSGGELQRINMARSLGNALTSTLFCLDEPSSGLHPRDSHNLLEVLLDLKKQGNTVVVVEHERSLIQGADHILEIGPEAGHEGGHLVYEGSPKEYKNRRVGFEWSPWQADSKTKMLTLKNAKTHNLKGVSVSFPLGQLTAICGVSGSGKTSLIQHTLYPLVGQIIGKTLPELESPPLADGVTPVAAIHNLKDIILVSQEGIGRSTRSNIASYLGIYSAIRDLLAKTPLAKARNLKPGYFSFNVAGGRCETCKGLGTIDEDLSFLGEMTVTCHDCDGKRFKPEALEISYRDMTVLDILKMTITEARGFFYDHKELTGVLDIVAKMGLGYMTLGQHTSSFSGGEAQRLKVAKFLLEKHDDGPRIFIFDEPTTGLSDSDVIRLLQQLRYLTDLGHTVLVVEHHLGVIRSADWLIEIGPQAADQGGQLVFAGRPVDLIDKNTETARFLLSASP